MTKLIEVVYIGKKPFAFDNVAGSGKCWEGNGAVQEVTLAQAKQLVKYPDQWALNDKNDSKAVAANSVVQVPDEDGQMVEVNAADLSKPLENMSKTELLALAKNKFGKELKNSLSKKLLIDAIEEFERDLEPVATGNQ